MRNIAGNCPAINFLVQNFLLHRCGKIYTKRNPLATVANGSIGEILFIDAIKDYSFNRCSLCGGIIVTYYNKQNN